MSVLQRCLYFRPERYTPARGGQAVCTSAQESEIVCCNICRPSRTLQRLCSVRIRCTPQHEPATASSTGAALPIMAVQQYLAQQCKGSRHAQTAATTHRPLPQNTAEELAHPSVKRVPELYRADRRHSNRRSPICTALPSSPHCLLLHPAFTPTTATAAVLRAPSRGPRTALCSRRH